MNYIFCDSRAAGAPYQWYPRCPRHLVTVIQSSQAGGYMSLWARETRDPCMICGIEARDTQAFLGDRLGALLARDPGTGDAAHSQDAPDSKDSPDPLDPGPNISYH